MHAYNCSENKLLNISLPHLLTHCLVCLMHKKCQALLVGNGGENM